MFSHLYLVQQMVPRDLAAKQKWLLFSGLVVLCIPANNIGGMYTFIVPNGVYCEQQKNDKKQERCAV